MHRFLKIDTHNSEQVQLASQDRIHTDPQHEGEVQPPRCAEDGEFLHFSCVSFATSGQMGHFRSKRGTYSRSSDCVLKIIPAEKSNISLYEYSVSDP